MKITDLKENDVLDVIKPYSDRLIQFTVVRNIVDDVLVLFNENNDKSLHLFYGDEEDMWYAKATFGIDVLY